MLATMWPHWPTLAGTWDIGVSEVILICGSAAPARAAPCCMARVNFCESESELGMERSTPPADWLVELEGRVADDERVAEGDGLALRAGHDDDGLRGGGDLPARRDAGGGTLVRGGVGDELGRGGGSGLGERACAEADEGGQDEDFAGDHGHVRLLEDGFRGHGCFDLCTGGWKASRREGQRRFLRPAQDRLFDCVWRWRPTSLRMTVPFENEKEIPPLRRGLTAHRRG